MSNIINKIRLSGTDYTLSATTSGGVTSGEVETMISAATSGYTARFAEDEEVTAAALNDLNERISGISGNNAVEVTQAEYDALVSGGTVDPTAFYIITDATPVDISNYWTSAQTNSAINAAVSGKQDTLSAGTGIDITNNVISATGGGGGVNVVQTTGTSTTDVMSQDAVTTALNNKANNSAAVGGYQFGAAGGVNKIQLKAVSSGKIGNEIYYPTINGKDILTSNSTWAKNNYDFQLVETSAITTSVSSSSTDAQVPSAKAVNDKLGGLSLVKLTQAEYDALATKDSNTLYVIVN